MSWKTPHRSIKCHSGQTGQLLQLSTLSGGEESLEGGTGLEGRDYGTQPSQTAAKSKAVKSDTGTEGQAKCSPKCQRLVHRYLYKMHVIQRDISLNQLGSLLYFLPH